MSRRSDKKSIFLGIGNTDRVIKRFFLAHNNDGGSMPIETFREQIPHLMRSWRGTAILNSYESIGVDPVSEIEKANDDLFATYWNMFAVGDDYRRVPKFLTPADYTTYDTTPRADVSVDKSVYRYNNTIPIYQQIPTRHYDRDADGSGLRGRSLQQETVERGSMADVWDTVNQPYKRVDTLDEQYYGQAPDDTTTRLTGRA